MFAAVGLLGLADEVNEQGLGGFGAEAGQGLVLIDRHEWSEHGKRKGCH